MSLEINLRLPGNSRDLDLDLAKKIAEVAIDRHYGTTAAEPTPPHPQNQCDNEGCAFQKIVYDEWNRPWLVYLCGGQTVCYPGF